MGFKIRNERKEDIFAITALTAAAFENVEHSSHTEQYIVSALRHCDQLSISLVAEKDGKILGHIAVSPIKISPNQTGWFGIGPISVWPALQRQGVGSALMKAALDELKKMSAVGCVVLGDPGYYGRFGFKVHRNLELPGVPSEYFQARAFVGEPPEGIVQYHEAFNATE